MMAIRVWVDFNDSGPGPSQYWNLRFGPERSPIEDYARDLSMANHMPIILYFADESEEFE